MSQPKEKYTIEFILKDGRHILFENINNIIYGANIKDIAPIVEYEFVDFLAGNGFFILISENSYIHYHDENTTCCIIHKLN